MGITESFQRKKAAGNQGRFSRPLSSASQRFLALALHNRSLAGLTGQDRARTAARIRALRASTDPAALLVSWWSGRAPVEMNGGTNLVQHALRGNGSYVRERIQARPTEYLREWSALAEVVASERTIRGLTRSELAGLAGVTSVELNTLERALPFDSISAVRRMLRALDIEPSVERFFAYVTADLLQRSDHRSVQTLESDIRKWVKGWNENPKPFIWTKPAEQILESLGRLLQRTTGAGH